MDEMYKFLTSVFKVVLTPAPRLNAQRMCFVRFFFSGTNGEASAVELLATVGSLAAAEAVIGAMNNMGVNVESAEAVFAEVALIVI